MLVAHLFFAAVLSTNPNSRIDDLSVDAASILRGFPSIAHVDVKVRAKYPVHRIIQLCDWHYVGREAFAADFRDQMKALFSEATIDAAYRKHLENVERVQNEQQLLLSALIDSHGVQDVFCEGFSEFDAPLYAAKIEAAREAESDIRLLKAALDPSLHLVLTRRFHVEARQVLNRHRRNVLQLGAAGKLLIAGRLNRVVGAEDLLAHIAANPVCEDGTLTVDHDHMAARRVAIARNLLGAGRFALVVLGAAHDLTDAVESLGNGECEYVRVTTMEVERVMGERQRAHVFAE